MMLRASSDELLEDVKVPVRVKLSALWASVMFCYVYGDYFGLYKPGSLQHMLDGRMEPLGPTTQGILWSPGMPGAGRWCLATRHK